MTFQIESMYGVEKACDREKRLDPKEKREKEKKPRAITSRKATVPRKPIVSAQTSLLRT
jgi:hypothetical protein